MTSPAHGTDAERLVAAAVARLVDEIGPEALDDGDRLRALLLDELGDDAQRVRRELRLVVDAAAEGVGSRLTHGPAVDLGRLSDEFADSMGLAAAPARWAVETFSNALQHQAGQHHEPAATEAPATLVFDPDSEAEPDAVPSAATPAPPGAPGEPGPTRLADTEGTPAPAYVPLEGASRPHHRAPRRRPLWLIPALVLLVAAGVGIALAVTRNDDSHDTKTADTQHRSATSSMDDNMSTSTPKPVGPPVKTAGEKQLKSYVPADFAASCASAAPDPLVSEASAHIACADGHLDLNYFLFPDAGKLKTYWEREKKTKPGIQAGTCQDNMESLIELYYQKDSDHSDGQLLCYHAAQAAHIQWDQPSQLVVAAAQISGNNRGMAHGHLVEEWRQDLFGPRVEQMTPVARKACGDKCLGM